MALSFREDTLQLYTVLGGLQAKTKLQIVCKRQSGLWACSHIAPFMGVFSFVGSNGHFAHLLRHTVLFRAKDSSVNKIEL